MTTLPLPIESIARVDLLLGRATMLTADRFDDLTTTIHEAMGITLLIAAAHPTSQAVAVPDLEALGLLECVERALREVHSWDLALAADLPDLASLRVLLADLRGDLHAAAGRRG